MIKVTNEVQTYNDDGKITVPIKVHNHWNEDRAVELEIDGKSYKVYKSDMIAAIENATNTNRHGY